MATLSQIISDVALMLPYSTATFTDAVLVGWMNDCIGETWRFGASTSEYMFQQTSGVYEYTMSTDMTFDKIKYVGLSDSTVDTSTCTFTKYTLAGIDDDLESNQYYKARGSTIGDVGLYPTPTTSGYYMKVIYESKPPAYSTGGMSTTIPAINTEYHDLLKHRLCKKLALSGVSGKNPKTDLFALHRDAENEIFGKMRMDYYKRRQQNPKAKWSYKEGWYEG